MLKVECPLAGALDLDDEANPVLAAMCERLAGVLVRDWIHESTVSITTHVDDASLRCRLRSRPLLLVLDNCGQVIDATAQLVDDILRVCADVVILATTRELVARPQAVGED
jgi:hypothetical protein